MIQRPWTLVSSFVMLASVGIVACSSADDPEPSADDGTGGAATGGSSSGGSTTGGSATGGTSSMTGGTSSTTGGTGGGGNPMECRGISRNEACTMEGLSCPNLVCGLADSGTRNCDCMTNWICSDCDFTNSQFKDPPPMPIEACPTGVAKEVPCDAANDGHVCGPNAEGDYCACYFDATDGQIWDCDSAPPTWGLGT